MDSWLKNLDTWDSCEVDVDVSVTKPYGWMSWGLANDSLFLLLLEVLDARLRQSADARVNPVSVVDLV